MAEASSCDTAAIFSSQRAFCKHTLLVKSTTLLMEDSAQHQQDHHDGADDATITVVGHDRGGIQIADKARSVNYAGYPILDLDGTDHINFRHSQCGHDAEIRVKNDLTSLPGRLQQRMELRCVKCNTPWRFWRKILVSDVKGAHRPSLKTTSE